MRLALLLAFIVGAVPGLACDCRRLPRISDAIRDEAPFVFAGRVLAVTERSEHTTVERDGSAESSVRFLDRTADFAVERAWRGVRGARFTVEIDASDCQYPFEPGKRYVVFAGTSDRGRPYTSICFRTAPLDEAAAVLGALGEPAYVPR